MAPAPKSREGRTSRARRGPGSPASAGGVGVWRALACELRVRCFAEHVLPSAAPGSVGRRAKAEGHDTRRPGRHVAEAHSATLWTATDRAPGSAKHPFHRRRRRGPGVGAAHDWGPGTRVPRHRIPEPEPRARGAAGARALRYLLVDDGDVPRNPLSQAALRQDRAAGDWAPRLELALLPQVLELAGALAEGEEVLCGGARAVRPRLGSGWRLPRYGHPSGPASGTLRCPAGLLCSSQSSRCCPPCPGPRVCWGDGGRRQAPCGMPRAWESGRGGQPRALMAPDTFQGSPRIQAKGTPGCGCILDKRK